MSTTMNQERWDAAALDRARRFLFDRTGAAGTFVEVGVDEPDLEALRWGTEIALLVGSPASDGLDFVAACRRAEGGFAMTPGEVRPSLAATYYAVRVLTLVGHGDLVPQELSTWVSGAVFGAAGTVAVDVDDLFYGVRALDRAGRPLPAPQRSRVSQFVGSCEDSSGGFGLLPSTLPDIERTYCCLQMRRILRAWDARPTDERAAKRHADFVLACHHDGRMLTAPDVQTSSLATMYWGVNALSLCDRRVPAAPVLASLASAQHPGGGFGDPGGPTLWHTYCALRIHQIVTGWGSV